MPKRSEMLLQYAIEAEETAKVLTRAGETDAALKFYADRNYFLNFAVRAEKQEQFSVFA